MGKKGPCQHCGTHNTPLWRNGPPNKPVLCNACGSMWKKRGTLQNYVPKHLLKPQPAAGSESENGHVVFSPCETNDKSSSDFSSSNNYIGDEQEGLINVKEGKKTLSTVESLRQDLLRIFREEGSSILQESPDDILIYHKNPFIPANEIGVGCILLEPENLSLHSRTTSSSPLVKEAPKLNGLMDPSPLNIEINFSEQEDMEADNYFEAGNIVPTFSEGSA